ALRGDLADPEADHRARVDRGQRARACVSAGTEPPKTIGIAGAGTMGAGIAQLACLSGARTLLHDPVGEALERGLERIRGHLKRGVERGRLSAEDAERASARLAPAPGLEDL